MILFFFFALGDLTPYSQWCFFMAYSPTNPLRPVESPEEPRKRRRPSLCCESRAEQRTLESPRSEKNEEPSPGAGVGWAPQWESSRNWGCGPFFGSFFRCVQIIEDLYDLYVLYIYNIIFIVYFCSSCPFSWVVKPMGNRG